MTINYHVHTRLCNHAHGTMANYIRSAVKMGLSEICFLDHLTLNPADRGLAMSAEEVPLYFFAVRDLADRFQERISVKVGLEVEYYPPCLAQIEQIVSRFSFDIIGCSVHFLNGQDIVDRQSDWALGKGDPDVMYNRYFEMLLKMLDADFFDVICHLDIIKKFGRMPKRSIAGLVETVLKKIQATGKVVEVNTSGYDHPAAEPYPAPWILKRCHELGIPVTLGSDAHRPQRLTNHYQEANALLASIGYGQLCSFTRRKTVPIAITNFP
ncbi:MAG: histidinol-phosphatase, partial [Deltaproteobacteria bacterium]|nr:histidinol-phosphatase [Deltaproteobacteria bacterium]